MNDLALLAPEQFCYLTTTGRKSGNAHTVEIWFAMPTDKPVLYILSGGGDRSDWVKNLMQNSNVTVRIVERTFRGKGRLVEDPQEDRQARQLVVSKYYSRDTLNTTGWEAESLPVAIDLVI